MTLLESHEIIIMQSYGWRITHEFSSENPDDHWWKAHLDDKNHIVEYSLHGLFEKWMEHPTVLAKQFNVEVLGGPTT